jgi:hypothetical protein
MESSIHLGALDVLRRTGPMVRLYHGPPVASTFPPPKWTQYGRRERQWWGVVAKLGAVATTLVMALGVLTLLYPAHRASLSTPPRARLAASLESAQRPGEAAPNVAPHLSEGSTARPMATLSRHHHHHSKTKRVARDHR